MEAKEQYSGVMILIFSTRAFHGFANYTLHTDAYPRGMYKAKEKESGRTG